MSTTPSAILEAVERIRNSNSDSIAILTKWKELLTSTDPVTITFANGETVKIPSILYAIRLYMGNIQEVYTLTDADNPDNSIDLRIGTDGSLTVTTKTGELANISAETLKASVIEHAGIRNLAFTNGTAKKLAVSRLIVGSGAAIRNANIENLVITGNMELDYMVVNNLVATEYLAVSGVLNYGSRSVSFNKRASMFGTRNFSKSDITLDSNGIWQASSNMKPSDVGFDSDNPIFADCISFDGESDPNSFTNEVAVYMTSNNGNVSPAITRNTRGTRAYLRSLWTWQLKSFIPSGIGYELRLHDLESYNGRIFCVRTFGRTVKMSRVFIIDYTGGNISAMVDPDEIVLPKYSCIRFRVEVVDATSDAISGRTGRVTVILANT